MRHEAWLMLEDGERFDCALSDISHIGARINIPDSGVIPDSFMLLLAENGAARRRCRVIWRKPRELGAKFQNWLDDRIRAAVPKQSNTAGSEKKASGSKALCDRVAYAC